MFFNKKTLTTLAMLMPAKVFAAESMIANLITEMIFIMNEFVFTIVGELSQQVNTIFIIGFSMYFFFTVAKYMITRKLEIWQFIGVMAVAIFVQTVMLDETNFKKWIYTPIVGTTMQTANYVLYVSSGKKLSNEDPLLNSMNILEGNFTKVSQIGARVILQEQKSNGGWIKNTGGFLAVVFKILILSVIYAILALAYPFIYVLGLTSMHILLAVSPICLMLGTIPKMRSLMMNWLREIGTFAFVPIFASIAMGMTVFILDQTTKDLDTLLASESAELPEALFLKLGLVGLFSIFFHIKSTSFAARVLGGQDSNFGQAFAAASTVGLGMAKTAGGAAANASGLAALGGMAATKSAAVRNAAFGAAGGAAVTGARSAAGAAYTATASAINASKTTSKKWG